MVLDKIGLTGSTGMLGSHIRSFLEEKNIEVISLSRHQKINVNFHWDQRDWLSMDDFDEIFSGVRAIIHAGAKVSPLASESYEDQEIFDANIRSCFNLGEWAIYRKIPLIFISGAIVYEDIYKKHQIESDSLGWNGYGGFYGFSKLLAEDIFFRLRARGLKVAVVRPTSIYGYGMPSGSIIIKFLSSAIHNQTINIYQPIDEQIDFIHANDVASAAFEILIKEKWNTYNLASGTPISIQELANSCITVAKKGNIKILGEEEDKTKAKSLYYLDTSFANTDLGWSPKVQINDGLKLILDKINLEDQDD